jgi:hypothetical protein
MGKQTVAAEAAAPSVEVQEFQNAQHWRASADGLYKACQEAQEKARNCETRLAAYLGPGIHVVSGYVLEVSGGVVVSYKRAERVL